MILRACSGVSKMSESASTLSNEEMIEEQIEECTDLLADIIEPRIDVDSDEDVYRKIDSYFGMVEQSTKDCFQDRFNTAQLYNHLRYIFLGIASEQGYHEKLQRETGSGLRTEDNVVNTYRWFKTYATVMLNEEIDLPYAFAIDNLNAYREDRIAHPTELPSPDQQADPVLLSSLLLIWNALEGVIRTWGRILDLDDDLYERRKQLLSDDQSYHVGFVDNVGGRVGYITSFQEGEDGQSIRMEPQHVQYFPSEGDVVVLNAKQKYDDDGDAYSSLSPDLENGRRVRKYTENSSE